MRKKAYQVISFGLMVLVALVTYVKPVSASPIELTYNSVFLETQIGGKMQKKWCEEVERRSKGRVKIKFYSAGKLYKYKPAERALASGALDISQFGIFQMGFILQACSLPCLFDSWDQIKQFHNQGGREILIKGLETHKLRPLFAIPFASITTILRKPVRTLEDVKGLKLRSPTAQLIDYLGQLGASNVHIATAEVYQALQLGTIDGVVSTTETYIRRKWHETVRYFLDTPLGLYPQYSVINLDKWNSLPIDIQKIMVEVSKEIEDDLYDKIGRYDDEIREKLRGLLETYALPPDEYIRWAKKARPVWDDWAKQGSCYAEALELAKKIVGK